MWYEESFPLAERRTFGQLIQLLDCPDMNLCAILEQEQLVGFIIYWQWDTLLYVEHFAIDPQQRGLQFGQKAMQLLVTLDPAWLVLEVELPTDDISRRRIQFYERQGFSRNPFAYHQPPYRADGTGIPMELLSIPAIHDQERFSTFSKQIRENVYERFYPTASGYKPIG